MSFAASFPNLQYQIELRAPKDLRPYAHNARTHSPKQIRQIADSIRRFGFVTPILIDASGGMIAGHGRLAAAELLGLREVPVLPVTHLTAEERRAYILADNRLAEQAGWDREILAIELQSLINFDFEIELLGFDLAEIDLIFTDPPYNVAVDGHVGGLGKVKHREFAFASGEMSEAEFTRFLHDALSPAAAACREGAIAFVCMDWRHMREMLAAGDAVLNELKNLCVWNKTNGGMGSFYRSKHELVFVWKVRPGRHINSFCLGDTGRYRTNVWDYPGVNSFGASRDADLAMHPTVKPVALIGDAIRDCSKRGDIVLDVFAGSGSTLIAAEEAGRKARLIEYDPAYCDTIIARWEKLTGKTATRIS